MHGVTDLSRRTRAADQTRDTSISGHAARWNTTYRVEHGSVGIVGAGLAVV